MGPGFFYYHRGPDGPQIRRALLLLAISGLLAFALYAGAQMRPLLGSLATTRVSNAVNRIVYQAVNEAIDSGQIAYEQLVSYEKDNEGRITMVRSNMAAFNHLQAEILDTVLTRISQVPTGDLSIPIGSLTGSTLLAGRGPRITVRMESVGSSEANFRNAFTSAGMDGSSDWRFKTHLANLPIYYEYKADGISSTDAIKGTYLDNYKQIWDLYITDSTCDPTLLASKTGNDAVAEFVGKKAVFYQNGTWAYNDVKDLGDDNLGMLPIYIGAEGEENQGLCTGSENFWCVNNTSSDEDIQATLDFLYWCVTSEAGTSAMADKMGFVIPFKKAKDSTNPLITIANQYVADGKTSVDWCFSTMPSEEWKNGVGSALTAYAAGTGSWDDVVTAFVDGWAKEYKLANG